MSTPLVGALFAQLAAVKVPFAYVGHVPVVAVRMSVNGRSPTTTDAAKSAAVLKSGAPLATVAACAAVGSPVLKVFFHQAIWVSAKRVSASSLSMSDA